MFLFPSIVTLSGFAVPLASPLQLPKGRPAAVGGESCADVHGAEFARFGFFVPVPLPTTDTFRLSVNCAVMLLFPSMVTFSGLVVPLASPVHPTKLCPALGVAVSCTTVPWL